MPVDVPNTAQPGATPPIRPEPSEDPGAADDLLIRSHLAGDEEAFAFLVRRHQEGLYRCVRGILRHSLAADDLTARALDRTHRYLDRYSFDRDFRTWLYKTGVNLAMEHLRRKGPGEGEEEDTMSSLTPLQRAVLVLRASHGLDYQAIAGILGIPEEMVLERLREARGRYRLPSAPQAPGVPSSLPESCVEIAALLDPYEDEALARSDRRKLERHLETCAPCRARRERVGAVNRAVREESLLQDPGPGYFEEFPRRLTERFDLAGHRSTWAAPTERARSQARQILPWIALLAFLIILAVFAVRLILSRF